MRMKPHQIDTVGASAGDGLVFNPDTDEYEHGTVASGGLTIQEEGVTVATGVTQLDFYGAATAAAGTGEATITVPAETLPVTIIDAKGDLIVGSADNTAIRKAVGTDNQVLTADSTVAGGVKWATPSGGGGMTDPTTTKGDLIVRGVSAPPTRLAVGSDGQVLTADAASANGVKWAASTGGGGAAVGAWTTLPLNSGWASNDNRWGGKPEYRIIGDSVQIRGTIRNSGTTSFSAASAFATLPVGARPPDSFWTDRGALGNNYSRLEVLTNGDISVIFANGGDTWFDFGFLEFSVTARGGTGSSGIAGSSSNPWKKVLDLPLTTLTDWTVASGTWSLVSSQVTQTSTGTPAFRLIHGTTLPFDGAVMEVEIQSPTNATGSENHAGIIIGSPGGNSGGSVEVNLFSTSGATDWTKIVVEQDAVVASATITLSSSVSRTTWNKLRVMLIGDRLSIWLNGVLIGSVGNFTLAGLLAKFAGLITYQTQASFRNLKVWNLIAPDEMGTSGTAIKDRRWTPSSTATSIDEFNDEILDPAWVRVDGTNIPVASLDWLESADVLSAYHKAADIGNANHGIMRPIGTAMVTGDAFYTCVSVFGPWQTNYEVSSLVLADGVTYGSGQQLSAETYVQSSGPQQICSMSNSFGYNAGSTVNDGNRNIRPCMPTYLRIVYLGGTSWRFDMSNDGVQWPMIGTVISVSSFTPTYVGLGCRDAGSGTKFSASFEFLRRVSGVT